MAYTINELEALYDEAIEDGDNREADAILNELIRMGNDGGYAFPDDDAPYKLSPEEEHEFADGIYGLHDLLNDLIGFASDMFTSPTAWIVFLSFMAFMKVVGAIADAYEDRWRSRAETALRNNAELEAERDRALMALAQAEGREHQVRAQLNAAATASATLDAYQRYGVFAGIKTFRRERRRREALPR